MGWAGCGPAARVLAGKKEPPILCILRDALAVPEIPGLLAYGRPQGSAGRRGRRLQLAQVTGFRVLNRMEQGLGDHPMMLFWGAHMFGDLGHRVTRGWPGEGGCPITGATSCLRATGQR